MFCYSQCCKCIIGGHTIFVDKELSVCVMQRGTCLVASVWQKVDHRLMAEELDAEVTDSTFQNARVAACNHSTFQNITDGQFVVLGPTAAPFVFQGNVTLTMSFHGVLYVACAAPYLSCTNSVCGGYRKRIKRSPRGRPIQFMWL